MKRRNPIRVWWYRRWCWVCRHDPEPLMPCSGGCEYATAGEAADAGRQHLRDMHGIEAEKEASA